jgi:hypothetical protein
MPNDFCGLSDAELAEVRERHRHFVPVRVDDRTTIFIDPSKDKEEAKKRLIKEVKYWRTKHLQDE